MWEKVSAWTEEGVSRLVVLLQLAKLECGEKASAWTEQGVSRFVVLLLLAKLECGKRHQHEQRKVPVGSCCFPHHWRTQPHRNCWQQPCCWVGTPSVLLLTGQQASPITGLCWITHLETRGEACCFKLDWHQLVTEPCVLIHLADSQETRERQAPGRKTKLIRNYSVNFLGSNQTKWRETWELAWNSGGGGGGLSETNTSWDGWPSLVSLQELCGQGKELEWSDAGTEIRVLPVSILDWKTATTKGARRGGDSSVGRASNWHARCSTDMGSSPGAASDFSLRVDFQCRLLGCPNSPCVQSVQQEIFLQESTSSTDSWVSIQPLCAIACIKLINICAHVKNPKHWQPYQCLDTWNTVRTDQNG